MNIPQIAFTASYEDNIKQTIWNAMDCCLESNVRLNSEKRWFKDFPEFVLRASPSWRDKNIIEVSNDFGTYFDMSITRINRLYKLIHSLFPNGMFESRHNHSYPITVHQIFRLGVNVWSTVDEQSVFFCEFKGLPEEYKEWSELSISFDYTYMMSDSAGTFKAGRLYEERMEKAKKGLDHKTCVLWYNYVLGRMRVRPQDSSFGIHSKDEWNTKANAYALFNIIPEPHMTFDPGEAPVNTPCIGFPPHPKKIGWMEGDWNMEYYYSGSRALTEEEYKQSLIEG